jgi:hypothetical protein
LPDIPTEGLSPEELQVSLMISSLG